MMRIRIGTRGSQLALWQARIVSELLSGEDLVCEIVTIKTSGDRLQEGVARGMAETVVHGLETVQIEVHHREHRSALPAASLERDTQPLLEAVAVGEVGQAVVIRDVMQRALRAAPRRDVVELKNQAFTRCIVVEWRAVQRYPDLALSFGDAAKLN